MVITLDFESSDPGSNPGRTSIFYRKNTLPTYGTRAYSVRRLNLLPYLPSTVNNLPITLHNTPCSLCTQPIRFKHNKKKQLENPGFDPGASRLQSAHSTD